MKKANKFGAVIAAAITLGASSVNSDAAFAFRAFARGARGAAGVYDSQGRYGQRAGARALGANQGGGIRGGQYAGPNGGSLQTGGVFGYKRGVGAFRRSAWNGQGPNGTTGSGYTKNQYNAQTGVGDRSSSEQLKTAAGQNYGYSGNTTYSKGQGGQSVIQTDNKGTYDVDWTKGQKPTVTPVSEAK